MEEEGGLDAFSLPPGRRVAELGVAEKDEWMSPRRFLGVAGFTGLLQGQR